MPIPIAMGLFGPNGDELPTRLEGESDARDRHPRAGGRLPSARYSALPTCRRRRCRRCCATSRPRSNCSGVPLDRLKFLASTIPTRWRAGMPGSRSRPACCSSGSRRAAAVPRCRRSIPTSSRRCGRPWPMRDATRHSPPKPWLCRAKAISRTRCRSSPSRRSTRRARAPARDIAAGARRTAERDLPAACRSAAPTASTARSIGRRALRNVCLGYLAAGDQRAGARLAKAQFDAGANMTDVLAALSVLIDIDCPERERGARGVLHALGGRSAGHRQMVRAAGALVTARHDRARCVN